MPTDQNRMYLQEGSIFTLERRSDMGIPVQEPNTDQRVTLVRRPSTLTEDIAIKSCQLKMPGSLHAPVI